MKSCKVLVYNWTTKEDEWIDGIITGYVPGDPGEDFERINVSTDRFNLNGCHPDCVKEV
jgi:hypothetical protein